MLAYSSISQVGYIILSLGVGTPLGLVGAAFHLFNHGVFKSLLFVNAGSVSKAAGTRDLTQMGGLGQRMPITGVTSALAFLSAAGIPPLAGFWSKLIIVMALWQAKQYAYGSIAIFASIITLGYFLLLERQAFFGKVSEAMAQVKEVGPSLYIPALILGLIVVGVGLFVPAIINNLAIPAGMILGPVLK
jgi:multicomponent Na+:H+ antiporter subunit D